MERPTGSRAEVLNFVLTKVLLLIDGETETINEPFKMLHSSSSEGGVLITQISEALASFEIWIFSYGIPTEQRSPPGPEQALRKIKSTVTLNHKQLIDLLVVQIL